jgi:TatD DNase family protein
MELIDSHCHLDFDYETKSSQDLIREANELGVRYLMTIGTDMKSIPTLEKLSEENECVFHTVGVHPHDAKDVQDEDLDILRKASQHPKCRAIGEIGLDYHYDHSPRDIQKKRLEDQLAIALEVKLPVVIHARDAEEDLLEALTRYTQKLSASDKIGRPLPGVIHCFSGTREFGEACANLGFFISFSGILTFKKAEDLRETAKALPLEKLMVETDSPFLAPMPYRGKRCEPRMVKETAQKIGEIKGISLEEVAQVTTENAKRLFKLP